MLTSVHRSPAARAAVWMAVLCVLAGLAAGPVRAQEPAPTAEPSAPDWAEPSPLASQRLLSAVTRAGERLVAVGDHGHILLSDDEGRSWRQASQVPARILLTSVAFANARSGWAAGHDAIILHTRDGGETWSKQFEAREAEAPILDLSFADSGHGLAVGAFALTLETADGGVTWRRRAVRDGEGFAPEPDAEIPRDGHLNAIVDLPNGGRMIAAEFGQVFVSPPAGPGGTWYFDRHGTDYDGSLWGGLATRSGAILAFGMRGTVRRSEDGGRSWVPVELGTDQSLTAATLLDTGAVVLVGLSGTIALSFDDGRTFQIVQLSHRRDLTDVIGTRDAALVVTGDNGAVRLELSDLRGAVGAP